LAAPCDRQGRLLVLEQATQMPSKVRAVAEVSKRDRPAKRATNLPRARGGVRRTLRLCGCREKQRACADDKAAKKPGHVVSPVRGKREPIVRAARNIVSHAR